MEVSTGADGVGLGVEVGACGGRLVGSVGVEVGGVGGVEGVAGGVGEGLLTEGF